MSDVMGMNGWELNRYRQTTEKVAGAYRVSETRICPSCKKPRSIRQYVEGNPFCLSCRRPRKGK